MSSELGRKNKITHTRGDTLIANWTATGLTTEKIISATFSVKATKESTEYLVHETSTGQEENNIEITDGKVVKVLVPAEHTNDLEAGYYYYDLQLGIDSGVGNQTVVEGRFVLTEDVSRNIEEVA